jgi:Golgi phosphoprotein 3
MTMPKELHLYEEIMLLALRDKEGTVHASSMYSYALGGAILAELLLRGRIRVEDPKKKLIGLADAHGVGDPLLDECLSRIAAAKKRASMRTWVSRFGEMKHLKDRIALQLCRSRILRADEDKVLGIFTRKIYPEIDPKPEHALIDRLREAVLSSGRTVEPRTVVLISIARSAEVLKTVFSKAELKERKARIEQIVNGEMVGKVAQEVIEAVQAVLVIAAVMPAIVAGATH